MSKKQFGSVMNTKNGTYQARYTKNYRLYTKTFKKQPDAYAWLDNEAKLIAFSEWTPPKERAAKTKEKKQRDALTVEKWLNQWKEMKDWKITTRQTNERALNNRILEPLDAPKDHPVNRLKTLPLHEVTVKDVYQWWDAVLSLYDTANQNNLAYKLLKAAFKAALQRGLIPANPVDIPNGDRPKTEPDHYLAEDWELEAILDKMPEHYKCLTVLCLYHGLRVGEALALSVNDVVETDSGLYVQVRKNLGRVTIDDHVTSVLQTPKTPAAVRDVPIIPSLEKYVRQQLEKRRKADMSVLRVAEKDKVTGTVERRLLTVSKRGKPVMDTMFRKALDIAKESAGIVNKITPHSGRRWLTTRLAELGYSPTEIGKIQGQKDLKVITEVYMQVRGSRVLEAMGSVSGTIEFAKDKKEKDKSAPGGNVNEAGDRRDGGIKGTS